MAGAKDEVPEKDVGQSSDDRSAMDWWDRIGSMRWQHIVLISLAVAAFVALCFAPAATCTISSTPRTTTTVGR